MNMDLIKYKRALLKRGWMQMQLAKEIGCTPQYLSKIANGKFKASLNIALKISEALNVELDYLFDVEMLSNKNNN